MPVAGQVHPCLVELELGHPIEKTETALTGGVAPLVNQL
jgi:hypothetical protein